MATGNLSLILALKGIGREVAANDHWDLRYKSGFRDQQVSKNLNDSMHLFIVLPTLDLVISFWSHTVYESI